MTRAFRPITASTRRRSTCTIAAPILVHGDAAFAGARRRRRSSQPAGARRATRPAARFTSSRTISSASRPIPSKARSTRYACDLAKGFDVPIVHVNADDVEACMSAVHFAIDFRAKFGRDVAHRPDRLSPLRPQRTRRAGVHAARIYEAIKSHPTVRELFAARARRAGRRHAPNKPIARCKTRRTRASRNSTRTSRTAEREPC